MNRWQTMIVGLGLIASNSACETQPVVCHVTNCTNGPCTTEIVDLGQPVPSQVAGDCQMLVCGGADLLISMPDDADEPLNEKPGCMTPTCQGGIPMQIPVPDGVSCSLHAVCAMSASCQAGECVASQSDKCTATEYCDNGTCVPVTCSGTVGFPGPPIRNLGLDLRDLVPFDLNGDGRDDLAVVDGTNNVVSVVVGLGNGFFGVQTDYPVGMNPVAIDSGDVNGDGLLDLVVANRADNTMSVLLNNGDETFAPKADYPAGANPTFVHLADVNGDGHLDLVTPNSALNATTILLNDGNGGFTQSIDLTVTGLPKDLEVVDMNKDGALDLAIVYGTANIRIFRNDGQGGFVLANSIMLPEIDSYMSMIEPAHIDDDGLQDLAIIGDQRGFFLQQLPNGNFQSASALYSGVGLFDMTSGDLNQDGITDFLLAGTMGPVGLRLWTSDAGAAKSRRDLPLSAIKGKFANLDGAGRRGYVAITGDWTTSKLKTDGVATYVDLFDSHSVPSQLPVPALYRSSIGDMNGDGLMDLVVTSEDTFVGDPDQVTIYLRNPDGSYQAKPPAEFPRDLYFTTLIDVDSDGDLDVIFTRTSSICFFNSGSGDLSSDNSITIDIGARQMVAADFDADGQSDLAYLAYTDNSIIIATNQGSGSFVTTTTLSPPTEVLHFYAEDLDNDGDVDLAVVSYDAASSTITSWLNDGSGGFTAFPSSIGTLVMATALADFNNDGYVDIAGINGAADGFSEISLFMNNGNAGFVLSTAIPVSSNPRGVLAGDFDGDGAIDLVLGEYSKQAFTVYRNLGQGAFAAPRSFVERVGGMLLKVADINGDHRLDLVTDRDVFLNVCLP